MVLFSFENEMETYWTIAMDEKSKKYEDILSIWFDFRFHRRQIFSLKGKMDCLGSSKGDLNY